MNKVNTVRILFLLVLKTGGRGRKERKEAFLTGSRGWKQPFEVLKGFPEFEEKWEGNESAIFVSRDVGLVIINQLRQEPER
jgi:hypothetical protein